MVMTRLVAGRHAVPVSEPVEPEVPERATRRVFLPQYKLRILEEYERRDRNGRGALLRREGLYTSSISEWRRQEDVERGIAYYERALGMGRGPELRRFASMNNLAKLYFMRSPGEFSNTLKRALSL